MSKKKRAYQLISSNSGSARTCSKSNLAMVLSGDLVLERLDGVVVRVDAKRSRSWNSASATMRSRQIRIVASSALSYVKYECKGPDRMSTSYPQGLFTHKN